MGAFYFHTHPKAWYPVSRPRTEPGDFGFEAGVLTTDTVQPTAPFTLAVAVNMSRKCDTSLSMFAGYCHIFTQKVAQLVGFFEVIRPFCERLFPENVIMYTDYSS
jgi:hypothetical protein